MYLRWFFITFALVLNCFCLWLWFVFALILYWGLINFFVKIQLILMFFNWFWIDFFIDFAVVLNCVGIDFDLFLHFLIFTLLLRLICFCVIFYRFSIFLVILFCFCTEILCFCISSELFLNFLWINFDLFLHCLYMDFAFLSLIFSYFSIDFPLFFNSFFMKSQLFVVVFNCFWIAFALPLFSTEHHN